MSLGINWVTLDHGVAVVTFATAILMLLLRSDLRRYFASKEDVDRLQLSLAEQKDVLEDQRHLLTREKDEVSERLNNFEAKQRHGLHNLEQRQVATEVAMAALKATMDSVVNSVAGVQRGVDMLIRHQIERERG